jgi:DNA-binding transcriptional regulator YhcF (GntR family)
MMAVEIDRASPVPAFEQLRSQINRAITGGALTAGQSLPTVRQLAADLELAPNTVGRTYRALEQEGLITTRGRRGTTVNEPPRLADDERSARLAAAAQRMLDEARALGCTAVDAVNELRRLAT